MSQTLLTVLVAILSIVTSSAVALATLLIYFRSHRKARYDAEEHHAKLEMLRDSLERKVYDATDRLASNDKRWMDINHLLLSRARTQPDDFAAYKKPQITNFLGSYGITEDDLQIDNELVFVLTPFNDRYTDEYMVIASACRELGLTCVRGDETPILGDLMPHILRLIAKARIIIANVDGRNPNVFYELGIAHAMDKASVLVTGTIKYVPLDFRNKKLIVFESLNDLKYKVQVEVSRIFVREPLAGPRSSSQ